MEKQHIEQRGLLWAGYILLFLSSFSLYFQYLGILFPVVLIGGYLTRSRFRRQGQSFSAAHASWQINTIWLVLLLGFLAVVSVFGIAGWMMESNPTLDAQLDAITNSTMKPLEMLLALWAIPGIKAIVMVLLLFSVLCITWPLKRILHGILALRAGLEPANLGSERWLALALALVLLLLFAMI